MNILYLHGMGGGSTSRVPNKLRTEISKMRFSKEGLPCTFKVICNTYAFDPEVAAAQIAGWVEEYHPDLVIGESMGAVHAMGVRGIPHLFISPSLTFERGIEMAKPLDAFTNDLGYRFVPKPKDPQRQVLSDDPKLLAKFKPMIKRYKETLINSTQRDPAYAFFGAKDRYMLLGVVSVEEYVRLYGDHYEINPKSGHFFSLSSIKSRLIPKIIEMLDVQQL